VVKEEDPKHLDKHGSRSTILREVQPTLHISYSTAVLYVYRDHTSLGFLSPKYHPKNQLDIFTL